MNVRNDSYISRTQKSFRAARGRLDRIDKQQVRGRTDHDAAPQAIELDAKTSCGNFLYSFRF
jgi:hypothetical protein